MFFKQTPEFFGVPIMVKIWMDSSAARGIFQRQGGVSSPPGGKARRVQDGLKEKKFELGAVHASKNLAIIGTKALNEATLTKRRSGVELISLEAFIEGAKVKDE